jgi:outer membrane protein TolC
LNLEQAVAIGINNSRALRTAAEAVQRARGVLNENRAAFLPTVGGTTTFTHIEPGASFTITENGQQVTVPIILQNQWQVNGNINVPIDLSGLITAAVQQSQFQEIASRLDFNRTRNDTILNIKNAYYDVLRAKALVTVAEQNLKDAQDQQTTAQQQLDAGIGTRFDVLRAATQVANAQQSLISARNQVNLTTATLNNVLGLDQNTPTTILEANTPALPAEDFNGAVAEAYAKRPEILQADANIRAAEKGAVLAQRSQMPTLGVGFTVGFSPNAAGFAPLTTTYTSVATLNMPLFDQGLSRARQQEARAQVETSRTDKQTTQDTVALQVRQAYLTLIEAQDRLNVTTAALGEAQEQYRLAQVRFKAGVTATPGASPLLEISDALAALTQAQTNQVTAQYDVQNDRARLDQAEGRYAYAGAGNPGLPAPAKAR